MLYEPKFKWMMPALLVAAWILSACVIQPTPFTPAPAASHLDDAEAHQQATVEALRALVAAQLHLSPEAVAVVTVEAVEWPDACLGAAGPNEVCTQVVTPGYRVTLAAGGAEYVYHTDRGPYWLRLVEGPFIDVGAPLITATVIADNGSCQDVRIGERGVAFGYCGLARFGGKFHSPARQATLAEFVARYTPFEAETKAGKISFAGSGDRVATPEEQLQLVHWAQLVMMEAASGAPMGGLAYAGPAEIGGDDASKCAALTMSGDAATLFDCAGDVKNVALNGGPLSMWMRIQDRFAPFLLETPTERLEFTGLGALSGDVWQQALLAWARTQYAEMSTGKASAAANTVLAWDLGPIDDMETNCMHLTVLAWGEAYAEMRACTGGEVQDLVIGWLETAEMEQLVEWLDAYPPFYVEQGYIAGAGAQETGIEELAAVEQWVSDLWRRIWESRPPQPGQSEDALNACPAPATGEQLFVDRSDGYCLLYPAGYVAEMTGDDVVNLVLGSIMNHGDPRVSIEVSDVSGRALEDIGDQLTSDYAAGSDILREMTTIGGEEALVLDNLPGQDLNRRVAVIHGDRLFSFFFTPLGEDDAARAAFEAFYRSVLDSFHFLDAPAGSEEKR